jgi:hypothetical protein
MSLRRGSRRARGAAQRKALPQYSRGSARAETKPGSTLTAVLTAFATIFSPLAAILTALLAVTANLVASQGGQSVQELGPLGDRPRIVATVQGLPVGGQLRASLVLRGFAFQIASVVASVPSVVTQIVAVVGALTPRRVVASVVADLLAIAALLAAGPAKLAPGLPLLTISLATFEMEHAPDLGVDAGDGLGIGVGGRLLESSGELLDLFYVQCILAHLAPVLAELAAILP